MREQSRNGLTRNLVTYSVAWIAVCVGLGLSGVATAQTPTGGPDAGIVESAIPGANPVPKFPADLLTGQFCSLPESRASDSRDADRDSPSRLPVTARFGGSFRLRRAGRGSS